VENEKMKPCVFGTETEFGLFVESTRGTVRPEPKEIAEAIITDLAGRYKHLPSPTQPPRLFLENGASVYVDIGGHLEAATAECTNPIDLAVHTMALRRMLAESAQNVARSYGNSIRRIWLLANNVDYAFKGPCTYGYHLNVNVTGITREQAAVQIAPLLSAMPIIAGTGKASFNSNSPGFELSQRAQYMTTSMGKRTVDSRAMITVKDEPLTDSGIRLHLICFDTPVSACQIALIPAIIAMTLKVIESGKDIAGPVTLGDPKESMQAVSCDPSLSARLPLQHGGCTTALDIHDHYIRAVAEFMDQTDIPDWFKQMLNLWREIVTNLRKQISLEVGRLDWVRKLGIFDELLRQKARPTWQQYSKWIYVIASIQRLSASGFLRDRLSLTEMKLNRIRIPESARVILEGYIRENRLSGKAFPKIWATAVLLCRRCLEYHALRPVKDQQQSPIEASLRITGRMVEKARTTAPQDTRAAVRSRAIRDAKSGSTAWWTFVKENGRILEMPNVLGNDYSWKEKK